MNDEWKTGRKKIQKSFTTKTEQKLQRGKGKAKGQRLFEIVVWKLNERNDNNKKIIKSTDFNKMQQNYKEVVVKCMKPNNI